MREKYGKETAAFLGSDVADANKATEMWWLFDEQGNPAKLPNSGALYQTLNSCADKFSRDWDDPAGSWFAPNNILPAERMR